MMHTPSTDAMPELAATRSIHSTQPDVCVTSQLVFTLIAFREAKVPRVAWNVQELIERLVHQQ